MACSMASTSWWLSTHFSEESLDSQSPAHVSPSTHLLTDSSSPDVSDPSTGMTQRATDKSLTIFSRVEISCVIYHPDAPHTSENLSG